MKKLTAEKKNKIFETAKTIFYPIAAMSLILIVWAIAAAALNKPLVLPEVKITLGQFFAFFSQTDFYVSVGWTLLRTLESFLLSVLFGAAMATLGALFEPVRRVFAPIITTLRAVPTMAVILLSVLWLDYDESPILIGFLICFPLLYSAFLTALRGIDKGQIEMAKIFKVRRRDLVRFVYIPSIAQAALSSMKSVISLAVKVVIAAEVIAQTRLSIGVMMQMSSMRFDTAQLLAWTVTAVALSFALEGIFSLIIKLTGKKRCKSKI